MITVIVPIYNTEKYLRRCINSIINQTYKDIEVILVDDGSTDNSELICKEYLERDNRVTYYRLENGGQGRARNYALDRCNGNWISFVDSDDWIENDMYEKMITIAENNDADIAICGWYRNHDFQQREQPTIKHIQCYNNIELMKEYLETPIITSSMCNKIYRSYLWKKIRFPEVRAREDMAILYNVIANSKKAVHIGESKYIQYVREGSTEGIGFTKNKLCSIDMSHEIKKYIEKNYPTLKDSIALKPAKYCADLMSEILSGFSLKQNRYIYDELYKQLEKELSLEYSDNIKNSKEYIKLTEIIKNQNKFKFNSYIKGIKKYIIDFVKNVYKNIINITRKNSNM